MLAPSLISTSPMTQAFGARKTPDATRGEWEPNGRSNATGDRVDTSGNLRKVRRTLDGRVADVLHIVRWPCGRGQRRRCETSHRSA
jgi:hypothetical protein